MERLTGFWNGQWTLSPEAQREGYDHYSVYSRLAAYENTGLTPGDIKDLQALCKKNGLAKYVDLIVEAKRTMDKDNERSIEQDERIEQLQKELAQLARESVEREKKLAKLEAESAALAQAMEDGRLVKVVRCGECVHRSNMDYEAKYCEPGTLFCDYCGQDREPADYCSHGERREKE